MKNSHVLSLLLASSGVGAAKSPALELRCPPVINNMAMMDVCGVLERAVEKSGQFLTETVPRHTAQGAKWAAANPGTAAAYSALGVGVAMVVLPGPFAATTLAALGFGSDGVVAGMSAPTTGPSFCSCPLTDTT